MEDNGNKIKVAEDIGILKAEVKNIKEKQQENHKEILDEFKSLRVKVNEEITVMHTTINTIKETAFNRIASNRKFYIKLLIITITIGTFIWIKESRDWILTNIFRIT